MTDRVRIRLALPHPMLWVWAPVVRNALKAYAQGHPPTIERAHVAAVVLREEVPVLLADVRAMLEANLYETHRPLVRLIKTSEPEALAPLTRLPPPAEAP